MRPHQSLPVSSQRGAALLILLMILVVGIMAVLLKGLNKRSSQMQQNAAAISQLAEVKEALYGFAQVNGRLPCPAIPNSIPPGAESPVGGGISCTRQHGFVPSATLGLKGAVNADGLLLDPWGNPLRYSVTNTAGTWDFTRTGRMKAVGIAALIPDLRVCREAACTNVIVNNITAVALSMGKNWATFTSADELANAGEGGYSVTGGPSGITYRIAANNNKDFVSTDFSEANFDDIITLIYPNDLYKKMQDAGQLP
jgi:type II secretory pathway pseudopilin PulG